MKSATTLTLTLAVAAATALSACGGESSPASSASPASTASSTAATAPRLFTGTLPAATGDVDALSWALQAEPATLDPTLAIDSALTQTVPNVLETLVRSKPDGSLEPGLAEEVARPDPRTRVYTLRAGVRFHDGAPLTSADVVASLDRARSPRAGSVWASAFSSVAGVKATGPLEVTVTLRQPDVLFDAYLATTAGSIESAAFLKKSGRAYGSPSAGIDGTGPYRFATWSKGQSLTLERADGYWDTAAPARSASLRFAFVADSAARTNALRTGAVDGSFEIDGAAYGTLQKTPAGRLYLSPGVNAYQLAPLNRTSVLGDARVRRALSLALDRDGLNKAAWGGYGIVARGPAASGLWSSLGPEGPALWAQAPVPEENIEEAKRLVREAGASGRRIVLVYHTAFALFPTVATAVQSAGKQIGLDVELRPLPFARAVSVWFGERFRAGYDLGILPEAPQTADPTEQYRNLTTGNGLNFGDWSNVPYDALVARALSEGDPAARGRLLAQAQAIVSDELPWIPLIEPPARLFLKDGLAGAPTTVPPRQGSPWAARVGAGG